MVEAISLTAVSAAVLTEGIKFLYRQADELLKHWRERRDAAGTGMETAAPAVAVQATGVLAGELAPVVIDFDTLRRLAGSLRSLRRELEAYVEGDEPIDQGNLELLGTADALRQILEAVYRQRITFEGERRGASGPMAEGTVDVEAVAGYASAVRARHVTGGHIKGDARARRVEPGAQLIGVDIEDLDERHPDAPIRPSDRQ